VRDSIYSTEYFIFESLLYDEDDVEPATVSGYVYMDTTMDSQFDSSEDDPVFNATVLFTKIDTINPDLSGSYLTTQTVTTNEQGYYMVENMMPGYYSIIVSSDHVVLQQRNLYVSSGERIVYNISQVQFVSLEGMIYFDINGNGIYDTGEEIQVTTVELKYIASDGHGILIDSLDTDETGEYEFSSVIPGLYSIDITKTNEVSGYYEYQTKEYIVVKEDTSMTANISIDLVPVTLSGSIQYGNETKDNIIISFKANTSIENNTADLSKYTTSNETGYYEVQLLPGYYTVLINATVNENEQDVNYYYTGQVEVTMGQGVKTLDMALTKQV
jgi:hypothetical protein